MSEIRINTCDVAVFIDQMHYDIITPFERFWKNNDHSNYSQLTNLLQKPSISKKEKLTKYIPSSLETLETGTPIEKKQYLLKTINETTLSFEKKQELIECANSVVNTEFGIENESKVIEIVNKKHKICISTDNKLYKKQISENFILLGRVDGIYDDYIIEVKNRMNGFFNKVRDYEMTQVQLYMWLLNDKKYVMLEEHYEGKIHTTQIFKDQLYIDFVLRSCKIFLENFQQNFLKKDDVKKDYLMMSPFQKKIYIKSLMPKISSSRTPERIPDESCCID